MMLVLFDVDKTLFLNSDPLMGQATTAAIEDVWGLKLSGDTIGKVNHAGQTATRITRELLQLEGLTAEEIDGGLTRWCEVVSARYLELLAETDTSDWLAPEGTAEALEQIERRALLTGNPEPVARARIEKLGLAEFFPPGQGAFGCDAEDRAELIDIARKRAGDWPREQTVAVGDTEADVSGAHRAVERLIHPQHLSHLWILAAAGIIGYLGNEAAAQIRLRAGKRLSSPAMIADGHHARADGYVSLGVVASAILVGLGLEIADPIIGLVITLVILRITWQSWRTVTTTDPGEMVEPQQH